MKRTVSMFLALLMMFSLAACGAEELPKDHNSSSQIDAADGLTDGSADGIGESGDTEPGVVSFDATYFAFGGMDLGTESFCRVLKDSKEMAAYLTENKLADGDYSLFFEPYCTDDFFADRMLVAIYRNESFGAYPVVSSLKKQDHKLNVAVETVELAGYATNGKRGVMILLAVEKTIAFEELLVTATLCSTENEEQYRAACELYQKGPARIGEPISFSVAESVYQNPQDIKGYECSADRALVIGSEKELVDFCQNNMSFLKDSYGASFFENKALILVFAQPVSSTQEAHTSVSGLYRVTDEDRKVTHRITVKYDVQQIGTDDIHYLCYIIEADIDVDLLQNGVQTDHLYINVWMP